jgi:hypothetical protein
VTFAGFGLNVDTMTRAIFAHEGVCQRVDDGFEHVRR